jgi:tetratricopeptide (TPR) repeat protein
LHVGLGSEWAIPLAERVLRIFVSSPGDVPDERRRVDFAVERLNGEFEGRVQLKAIRWETSYYSAHDTFQEQIPEAADCDLVVAIFRARLGTQLPDGFQRLPSGEPYPSGTAYEVLSAIGARKSGKELPDIYVFRYSNAPHVALDALDTPEGAEIKTQWERLKSFFDTWFRDKGGQFLAAFQEYASTDDFARKVEDCLRQWLGRHGLVAQGAVWDRGLRGSPFPGLAAFEADRGSVFFGRELAIAQAVERLRQAGADKEATRWPFLLVIGASGSGKSSLLRAGLLPRLVSPGTIPEIDLWRTAIVMPGPDPFAALAESLLSNAALGAELLQGPFRTEELLAKLLAGNVETATALLRDALDQAARRRKTEAHFDQVRPARLALAIDQGERLFVEAEAKTVAAFAELLAALVRRGLAYVVMALRSDAYARFQRTEALVGLREAGATFDLVPPSTTELEEIVTRPVAACQPPLALERKDGRSLASQLVADAKRGDALPLLQMTLSRLYAAETARGDGLLRFADYRGMDAAVTETANEALDALSDEARAELPSLVAGLVADVSADPVSGAPTPVIAALDRKTFEAQSPARQALVEAFVAKRLLTAEGDGISERVRPVHEALLRIWPQAVAIVAEAGNLIRVRHTLGPIVRAWEEARQDKAHHLDISPALLGGAQLLVARFGADLPTGMRDFVAASSAAAQARERRGREEQERRLRDAQALATANRRTARRTGAGLAAAIVLVVLAGWQWRTAQAQRDLAESQRERAETALKDAQTQRDRAERTLALATSTANSLVFDLAKKFRDVVGVPAATIKDILDRARQLQDQLLGAGESSPELLRSQAEALIESTITLLTLGDTQGALATARQAREIFQALLAKQPASTDFQRELSVSDEMVGDVEVAQGHLPDALESYSASLAIRDQLAKSDSGNAFWQHDLAVSYNKVGDVEAAQGQLPEALKSYSASLAILDRLAKSDPGNAGWQHELSVSHDRLGDVQQAQGDLPAALASYRATLDIAERLAKSDPGNAEWQHDLAVSHNKVGGAQLAQGDLPAALTSYQATLDIAERLAKSDPGNAVWQHDLAVSYNRVGDVQSAQGDLPAALTSYRATLAITERLGSSDPGNAVWQHDLAVSYNKIGDVQLAEGNLPAALTSYQATLAITERLGSSDPGNAVWQHDLAVSYNKIGDVQLAQGHLPAALTSYQATLAIAERLAKSDPGNASWQRDLSISYEKIGDMQVAQGKLPAAMTSYRTSLDIRVRLAKSDPSNAIWQRDLSVSYEKIGDVQAAEGSLPAALTTYQASLDIRERLAKSDPGNGLRQSDLSISYEKLGHVQEARGNLPAALASYQASLDIRERLAKSDPGNTSWQRDLSISHEKVGFMQLRQGDLEAALISYQAGLAVRERLATSDPGNTVWQHDLAVSYDEVGLVQQAKGSLPAALISFQASLVIRKRLATSDPGNTVWQNEFSLSYEKVGDLLFGQGNFADALNAYQTALAAIDRLAKSDTVNAEWQRKLSIFYGKVGDVLFGQGHPDEAVKSYELGLAIADRLAKADSSNGDLRGDLARDLRGLGVAKLYTNQPAEAANNFVVAVNLEASDAYGAIWLHIARARGGQEDAAELAANAAALSRSNWPWPVVALFLHETSPEAVRASASAEGSQSEKEGYACEADFYLAIFDLEKSQPADARPLLESAVRRCPPNFIEAGAARLELQRLR